MRLKAGPGAEHMVRYVFRKGNQEWTRSLKPEWRGSGLLTRGPVDRNHSRPLRHSWTSYRSGRTGGLLIRWQCRSQVRILLDPSGACTQRQRERVESASSPRDEEVAGSNPATPTNYGVSTGVRLGLINRGSGLL